MLGGFTWVWGHGDTAPPGQRSSRGLRDGGTGEHPHTRFPFHGRGVGTVAFVVPVDEWAGGSRAGCGPHGPEIRAWLPRMAGPGGSALLCPIPAPALFTSIVAGWGSFYCIFSNAIIWEMCNSAFNNF